MKLLLKRKTEILLVLILISAAILRLYRIGDYLTFLGDEGRDVLIVKHILEGHLTFLGPRASAGDFFTGPIYYYMIAPFLWLWHLDPTGPAVFIALLSVATVYLIYRFGKEWFGTTAALVAATLYSFSPLVLQYSRSSWNPNPMPFFTLLLLYILYKGIEKKKIQFFFLSGLLYGIAFQLHYIELAVAPTIFFFVLFGPKVMKKSQEVVTYLKQYALLVVGYLTGMSPFLIFEARHGFPNTRTIFNFLLHGDPKATDIVHTPAYYKVYDVFFRLFGRLLFKYPPIQDLSKYPLTLLTIWHLFSLIIGIIAIIYLFKVKNKLVVLLFGLWIFFGVSLFAIYSKPIYDYYFEFMFVVPFLLFGNLLALRHFGPFEKYHNWIIAGTTILLSAFLFYKNILWFEPNHQKQQVESIDKFILSKTDGKPFNFALLTEGNSDQGYRYYFEVMKDSPTVIDNTINDPQRKTVTDQLFVVCEDLSCKPLGNSLFEVAGFGRAEIAQTWDYSVVKIYKLKQYTGK